MEEYRTEEEQVEALRKWWDENGKSIVLAVVVALGLGFGYQGFKAHQQSQREEASNVYQSMMRAVGAGPGSAQQAEGIDLANQLKNDFPGTTYAQFAALHLAAIAVGKGDLMEAETQLRWVLGKADAGSDTAQVAQLRLARVMASNGAVDRALEILEESGDGYGASYAAARGDILMVAGRTDEARDAYVLALAQSGSVGNNLVALRQKLQALTPMAAADTAAVEPVVELEPEPVAAEQVQGDEPDA